MQYIDFMHGKQSRSLYLNEEKIENLTSKIHHCVTNAYLYNCSNNLTINFPHIFMSKNTYNIYSSVHVIIVAIENYPSLPKKEGAVANTALVQRQFIKMGYNVHAILENENATNTKILEEFVKLRGKLEQINQKTNDEDVLVIFYFIGHSFMRQIGDEKTYFIGCHDIDNNNLLATACNIAELITKVSTYMLKHLCFIMDCDLVNIDIISSFTPCYNGVNKNTQKFVLEKNDMVSILPPNPDAQFVSYAQNKSYWLLCAANCTSFTPYLVQVLHEQQNCITNLITLSENIGKKMNNIAPICGKFFTAAPFVSGVPMFFGKTVKISFKEQHIKRGKEHAEIHIQRTDAYIKRHEKLEQNIKSFFKQYKNKYLKKINLQYLVEKTAKSEMTLHFINSQTKISDDNLLNCWKKSNHFANLKTCNNNQCIKIVISGVVSDQIITQICLQLDISNKLVVEINVAAFELYLDSIQDYTTDILLDFVFEKKMNGNKFFPEDKMKVLKMLMKMSQAGDIVYFLKNWAEVTNISNTELKLNVLFQNNSYNYITTSIFQKDSNIFVIDVVVSDTKTDDTIFIDFCEDVKKMISENIPQNIMHESILDHSNLAEMHIDEKLIEMRIDEALTKHCNINSCLEIKPSQLSNTKSKKMIAVIDFHTNRNKKYIGDIFPEKCDICQTFLINDYTAIVSLCNTLAQKTNDIVPWMIVIHLNVVGDNIFTNKFIGNDSDQPLLMSFCEFIFKSIPAPIFILILESTAKSDYGKKISPKLMNAIESFHAKNPSTTVIYNRNFVDKQVHTQFVSKIFEYASIVGTSILGAFNAICFANTNCTFFQDYKLLNVPIASYFTRAVDSLYLQNIDGVMDTFNYLQRKKMNSAIKQLNQSSFLGINRPNTEKNMAPLISSLINFDFETSLALLSNDDIDVTQHDPSTGNTALHIAAAKFQQHLVKLIVSKKPNINILNFRKQSPLFFAFKYGTMTSDPNERARAQQICTFLIQNGADPNKDVTTDHKNSQHDIGIWKRNEPVYCDWYDKVSKSLSSSNNNNINTFWNCYSSKELCLVESKLFEKILVIGDSSQVENYFDKTMFDTCDTFNMLKTINYTKCQYSMVILSCDIINNSCVLKDDHNIELDIVFAAIGSTKCFIINGKYPDVMEKSLEDLIVSRNKNDIECVVYNRINVTKRENIRFLYMFFKNIIHFGNNINKSFLKAQHYIIQQSIVSSMVTPYHMN